MIPRELIDPEGEGVYFHMDVDDSLPRAAWLFFGDRREFRNVDSTIVYMREGEDGCWYPASPGRFPRYWRLNLPRRWRPETYVYYTPKPDEAPA